MTSFKVLLLFLALWAVSFADDNGDQQKLLTTKPPAHKSTATASISPDESQKNTSSSSSSSSSDSKRKNPDAGFSLDSEMIQRALYVLIGITAIGVLYFLVRAVRLKKTTVQRKKYGLLSNYDDTMEMGRLESDDDDNTVYEANSMRR